MVESGDVAFVKHTTFAAWNAENGGSNSKVGDLQDICNLT